MLVKKFEAPTIQEALETIKRELGPEAIILQTKKNRRGFGLMSQGSIEVTAAVSERSIQKKNFAEKRLPEPTREAVKTMPAERQAKMFEDIVAKYQDRSNVRAQAKVAATPQNKSMAKTDEVSPVMRITSRRYIDIEDEGALQQKSAAMPISTDAAPTAATPAKMLDPLGMSVEEEVRQLKRMVEELKSTNSDGGSNSGVQALGAQSALATPALQSAFEQLVVNGMEKRFALNLIRKAGFEIGDENTQNPDAILDQLAVEIVQSTHVTALLTGLSEKNEKSGPKVVALVGPTGVGKTTTVAKVASEALLKRNLKVGLINLDSYKVAAFDQLGTYAKILNVPFRSVQSVDDLKNALQDFASLDLVLLDTTGRSQKDPASLKEMHEILSQIEGLQTQLVLAATTRDTELYDMASRFNLFKPQGLILSKLDEATIYGAVYNVSQKVKLPLTYFTTGQRVPEDLEEATPERVAALILDI